MRKLIFVANADSFNSYKFPRLLWPINTNNNMRPLLIPSVKRVNLLNVLYKRNIEIIYLTKNISRSLVFFPRHFLSSAMTNCVGKFQTGARKSRGKCYKSYHVTKRKAYDWLFVFGLSSCPSITNVTFLRRCKVFWKQTLCVVMRAGFFLVFLRFHMYGK